MRTQWLMRGADAQGTASIPAKRAGVRCGFSGTFRVATGRAQPEPKHRFGRWRRPATELRGRCVEEPALSNKEIPLSVPADRPGQVPADRPGQVPADRPGQVPADRPGQVPADRPRASAGGPARASAGGPYRMPARRRAGRSFLVFDETRLLQPGFWFEVRPDRRFRDP